MKPVAIMNPAKRQITTLDEQQKSNTLNVFYLRYDTQNLSKECGDILQTLHDTAATCWLEVDPPTV